MILFKEIDSVLSNLFQGIASNQYFTASNLKFEHVVVYIKTAQKSNWIAQFLPKYHKDRFSSPEKIHWSEEICR